LGITVIPLATAEKVLEKAREQGVREVATREWIKQGKIIEDLLAEFVRI